MTSEIKFDQSLLKFHLQPVHSGLPLVHLTNFLSTSEMTMFDSPILHQDTYPLDDMFNKAFSLSLKAQGLGGNV